MHPDPLPPILLALAVILVGAKLGGDACARRGQPPVLGELIFGVLLGNLVHLGVPWMEPLRHDTTLEVLAGLGAILLLFQVGLESTVSEILQVGWTALRVAALGVACPFLLGFLASGMVMSGRSVYVHAFVGATLTATSVGITARVLKDLGRLRSPEGRIILGAAVIDDVLGLTILAVVSGVIRSIDRGSAIAPGDIGLILAKAALFLTGSLVLGAWLAGRVFHLASRLQVTGVLTATSLSLCFALAYLAGAVGLAPIVGAYAAGLILEDVHFQDFRDREEHGVEDLVKTLAEFLVPIFFVRMGMQVDLASFASREVLLVAFLLTAVAIVGKLICGAGVGAGVDRLVVGIGMVPRGEVGLIFANIGLGLTVRGERILDPAVFSALVVMVIVTTLVTPVALKWSVSRAERAGTGVPAEPAAPVP